MLLVESSVKKKKKKKKKKGVVPNSGKLRMFEGRGGKMKRAPVKQKDVIV